MAETVRVLVRCRPMNRKEQNMKCKNIIEIKDCAVNLENPLDTSAPVKTFTYDNAYGSDAPTESIYNDICYSLVENVLEGYNGTIFAYGQTGCGKSHTMQGPDIQDPLMVPSSQRGIISRSFDHIFEAISVATDIRYLALVSYLEIYNENIHDLLNPNENLNGNTGSGGGGGGGGGGGVCVSHQLKEIPGEGVVVQNLSTHAVHNAKECEELLRIGAKNRMVGSTLMNAGSSRSHSIFTISLEQIETKSNQLDTTIPSSIRKGKLNLVDLAGSERQNKTGATGDRLKEATKINLSLSALGNVISALVDGKTKHIPYRDSKLTRLLQDSLGGNTKTLMIACISPADYNYDETLSTLRYASRAKNIQNKPIINEDPKDTMLKEYQREIMELKKLLEATGKDAKTINHNGDSGDAIINAPIDFDQSSWLEAERAKLRAEYEAETLRLKNEHENQQKEKEELVKDMERLKAHYEKQMKNLTSTVVAVEQNNNNNSHNNNNNLNSSKNSNDRIPVIQQEALNRIEMIKNILIGGERANDVQLKEKRYKKKLAAQRRLSALAHALSRVEQAADRDLLQEHYSDIQQELKAKDESIKSYRQKVRALEREISDLQSEFQLDRTDYLESIRRLERNLKFYQQLLDKALPILRKDGKYWDPDTIQHESTWNDDLKKWKLPEESMNRFKLPPAATRSTTTADRLVIDSSYDDHQGSLTKQEKYSDIENISSSTSNDIAETYFRPKRTTELIHQRKGFNWRDFTKAKLTNNRNMGLNTYWKNINNNNNNVNNNLISPIFSSSNNNNTDTNSNSVLASWLSQSHHHNYHHYSSPLSRSWCGLSAVVTTIPKNFSTLSSSGIASGTTTSLNDIE